MNLENTQFFFAFDGDSIGRRHAQAILSDNVEDISNVSSEITHANEMVRDFVESNGGKMVSFGGDEGVFEAPTNFIELLEQLRKDYEYMVGATLSIGYGTKPSEAAKALLKAKETGKNKVVAYDEDAENYAQDVQDKRDEEHQEDINQEENNEKILHEDSESKINEPTLCEPAKNDNNLGYDSGYKNSNPEQRRELYQANDLTAPVIRKPNLTEKPPIEEATCADVPESDRKMNNELPDPKDKEAEDKKPAPKDYTGQAEGAAPESLAQPMEEKPSDLKYSPGDEATNEPGMPEENATTDEAENTEEQDMLGDKHCPSCTCEEHEEAQPIEDILEQHIENAQDLENEMDSAPENENDMDNVLDAHVSNATEMNQDMDENAVSRPGDYNQKQGDMGLSEEEADNGEPQLDDVLRDGLDAHADNIQKEKVLNMVGEALEGFKAQKQILDKAKEQAPELYASCIAMLKAMIELCSLAGIDQGQAEQDINEIEGQSKSPEEMPGEEKCPNCGHEKPAASEEEPPKAPQQ